MLDDAHSKRHTSVRYPSSEEDWGQRAQIYKCKLLNALSIDCEAAMLL